MDQDPFKPLQEVIDQEHAEANGALAILRRYLAHRGYSLEIHPAATNGSTTEIKQSKSKAAPARRKKSGGAKQSFRAQVDKVIQREYHSIDHISEATGLDKKQIRGVLYSPLLSGLYDRKPSADGHMTFKLKPEAETAG